MIHKKSINATFSSSSSSPSFNVLQKTIMSYRNRSGLLIFSLLYILIVLTQQPAVAAAALYIPTPPLASSEQPSSLVLMISPQEVNNSKMASPQFVPEIIATNVLTPGQQVINAVPTEDRYNFIMYQLAVALISTDQAKVQPRWLNSLELLVQDFENRTPELKNVPIYGNFSTDLLIWLMEKFQLTQENVYNHLWSRSQLLCTSDGVCYCSKDITGYCCPF